MFKRLPFYKPIKFKGAFNKSLDLFIQKYNKAIHINGWTSEKKVLFIAIYLQATASTFLDNFENTNSITTWTELENALRLEFESPAEKYMLKNLLEKRKQLPNETIASYINAEHLCKRINLLMSQAGIVYRIMKGLKTEIIKYIGILENSNLTDLKRNIKKYESNELIVNYKTNPFPGKTRNQISNERINAINDKNTKQLEILSSKMSNLESILNN